MNEILDMMQFNDILISFKKILIRFCAPNIMRIYLSIFSLIFGLSACGSQESIKAKMHDVELYASSVTRIFAIDSFPTCGAQMRFIESGANHYRDHCIEFFVDDAWSWQEAIVVVGKIENSKMYAFVSSIGTTKFIKNNVRVRFYRSLVFDKIDSISSESKLDSLYFECKRIDNNVTCNDRYP